MLFEQALLSHLIDFLFPNLFGHLVNIRCYYEVIWNNRAKFHQHFHLSWLRFGSRLRFGIAQMQLRLNRKSSLSYCNDKPATDLQLRDLSHIYIISLYLQETLLNILLTKILDFVHPWCNLQLDNYKTQ